MEKQDVTLPRPLDATSVVGGGYTEGTSQLKKFKEKFDMLSRPAFEKDFTSREIMHVAANAGGALTNNTWEFDLKPYQGCARDMTGVLEVEMRIRDNANKAFPTDIDAFGNKAVWLRPGAGPNLISEVSVLVNGQNVYTQEYHESVNYIMQALTMRKENEDVCEREYGGGFYRREHVNTDSAGRTTYNGEKLLGPNTMPSKETTQTADKLLQSEQDAYSAVQTSRLPGSNTILFRFKMEHPMFHSVKMYPPEFSCKIRVKLNRAAVLFQCESTQVPKLEFVRVEYVDELIKLNEAACTAWTSQVVRAGNKVKMPILRKTIYQHSVPRGLTTWTTQIIKGTIPTRIALAFVPNDAWRSGSSVRNQFNFPYLGVKKMHLRQDLKYWPGEKKNVLQEVQQHTDAKWPDAEIETLIRRNYFTYKDNMSVFTPAAEVHHLAMRPEDWFTSCNFWCFDLSPTGHKAAFPYVSYPVQVGHLELDVEFANPISADTAYTLIVMAEHNNEMEMKLPTFEMTTDF